MTTKPKRESRLPYLQTVRGLLIGAMGLKKAKPELPSEQVQFRREALEDSADRLLKPDRADSLTEIEDFGPVSAGEAAGSPVCVSRPREGAGDKQPGRKRPGRAATSPGGDPPQA